MAFSAQGKIPKRRRNVKLKVKISPTLYFAGRIFQMEIRDSFFKAIFDTRFQEPFSFRLWFAVFAAVFRCMELIFKHDKRNSRKKLTSPELRIPFNQTVKNWFAHVNGKQPVLPVTFRENEPTLLHARSCLRSMAGFLYPENVFGGGAAMQSERENPAGGIFPLTCNWRIFSLLTAPPPKECNAPTLIPPAAQGMPTAKFPLKQSFLLLKHLFIHTKFSIRIILIYIVLMKIELTFD